MKRNIFPALLLATLLASADATLVSGSGLGSTTEYTVERDDKDFHSRVRIGEADLSFEMDRSDEEDIVPSIREAPTRRKSATYESTRAPSRTYERRRTERKEGTKTRGKGKGIEGKGKGRGSGKERRSGEGSKARLASKEGKGRREGKGGKARQEAKPRQEVKSRSESKGSRQGKRGKARREGKALHASEGRREGKSLESGKGREKGKGYAKRHDEARGRGKSNSKGTRGKIEGQNDKYPAVCHCRALRSEKVSVCYDMVKSGQSYGRCKKRKCGKKYECVPGGGKGLKTCIRRIARKETKLRRNEGGVALCNVFKMKKPKVFYTLYV